MCWKQQHLQKEETCCLKYKSKFFVCLLFWTNKQILCNFFSNQLVAKLPTGKFLQQGIFLDVDQNPLERMVLFEVIVFIFFVFGQLGSILGEKWFYGQIALKSIDLEQRKAA